MSNHVHFIWQALYGHDLKDVQASFAKHTSKEFLKLLSAEKALKKYEVDAADRQHAFWKRNPLGTELFTPAVFYQKLDYIHNNPVRAGLCKYAEEYNYSSALYCHTGKDETGLLEHWAA
ncbi:MAG: hypothetical protein WKF88_01515 [Ferruginibacter sp.]